MLHALPLGVFVTIWQFLAWWLKGLLFPSFSQTIVAFAQLVMMPILWRALWISHQALILGFAAAVVVGTGIGLLMGRSRIADGVLDPYLMIMLVTPMSALIPLVIITFGIGLLARALVVMLFAVVVIVVNTRAGVRTLDPSWVEMVRSFGANERQIWRTVVVPAALPAIVTGLRLGLGRAFAGMVAVELLLVSVGVGRLILNFQGRFEAGAVYATVVVLVAEVTILLRLLRWVELRLTPSAGGLAVE